MNRILAIALFMGLLLSPLPAHAQEAGAPAPDAGETFQVLELTPDQARKAFDAYLVLHEKFNDAAFEDYDSLADFVARAPEGKDFEAVVKSSGFASVDAWLPVINALEFTIGAMNDNQTQAVEKQIEEVTADASLSAQDKARMVAMLKATVPSENNRKVLEGMLADPAYAEKLKAFMSED